jgi:hypothetical protein
MRSKPFLLVIQLKPPIKTKVFTETFVFFFLFSVNPRPPPRAPAEFPNIISAEYTGSLTEIQTRHTRIIKIAGNPLKFLELGPNRRAGEFIGPGYRKGLPLKFPR